MKRFIIVFLSTLLLFGCGGDKTAEQQGTGISVEVGDIKDEQIRYVGITVYLNELLYMDDNIYKDDYSFFQDGDIVWFNIPIISDKRQEIEVHYSNNPDGSDTKTTNKIDITEANKWVNTKIDNDLRLEILAMD